MFKMTITEINFSFRAWCFLEIEEVELGQQSHWQEDRKTGLQGKLTGKSETL